MGWLYVGLDLGKQDQVQVTYDPQSGNVSGQRIQTWIAQYDGDARTVDAVAAVSASVGGNSIPAVGGIYSIGGVAGWTCTRAMPQRTGPSTFSVEVEFSRKTTAKPDDKDKWAINLNISGEKWIQSAWYDRNGDHICNSAGFNFEDTLTKTFYDEKVQVSYKTLSPPDLRLYRGKANSNTITFNIQGINRTYNQYQIMLEDGSVSTTVNLDSDSVTPVWDVKLDFISRPDTFRQWVLDAGFMQIVNGPAKGGGVRKDTGLARVAVIIYRPRRVGG